jgi:ABC-2 type transport system ATP-binding protein
MTIDNIDVEATVRKLREQMKQEKNISPAMSSLLEVFLVLVNHSGYYGIADNSEWIKHLLEKLHLIPFANRNSKDLSGGMKRRLTIAKALVHRPKLLILDEPSS